MNLENIFKVVRYKDFTAVELGCYIIIEEQNEKENLYRILINDTGHVVYDADDPQSSFAITSLFYRKMLVKPTAEEMEEIKIKLSSVKVKVPLHVSRHFDDMIYFLAKAWQDTIAIALRDKRNVITDEVNYISVTKDGFRFLPTGKELVVDDSGAWLTKNRQVMKFSKLIKKILKSPNKFSDSQYESFSNRVKSYIGLNGDEKGEGKYELQVIEGEAIRKAYLESNCSPTLCSGGSSHPLQSCMRYSKCQAYLDMYVDNPSFIKMLVLKDFDGLIGGRALLWLTLNKKYMDRVYGTDAIISMFKAWAIENGYYYKSLQSNSGGFDMLGNGHVRDHKVKIPINLDNLSYFPYLDTLYYYNYDKKYLSNKAPKSDRHYVLRSTSGTFEVRNDYSYFTDGLTGQRLRTDRHVPVEVRYQFEGNEVYMITDVNNTVAVSDYVGVEQMEGACRVLSRHAVAIGNRRYRKDDGRIRIVDGVYGLVNESGVTASGITFTNTTTHTANAAMTYMVNSVTVDPSAPDTRWFTNTVNADIEF